MEKRWIGKGNLDERGVLRHMGDNIRGRDGGGGGEEVFAQNK